VSWGREDRLIEAWRLFQMTDGQRGVAPVAVTAARR
jgi:hypothetical protein